MPQLHAENRALKSFHPVVISAQHMVILAILSPIAQRADGLSILNIVSSHSAAFAICTQIFGRIKTKTRNVSDAAGGAALVFRTMRLCCIFDHDQSMTPRDFHDRIHVGRLTVKMYRKNGFGAGRDRSFNCARIQRERAGIDIDQHWTRARVDHGRDARHKRERHGDDFVARPNAGSQQRQVQSAGSRVQRNAVACAAISPEILLERRDLSPKNELGTVKNTSYGRVNFRLDAAILCF